MPEKTLNREESPVQEMTPLEALRLLSQYVGGFIAWKADRSSVYAMALTEEELKAKLAQLGVTPDEACIDPIGQFTMSDDYGYQIDKL